MRAAPPRPNQKASDFKPGDQVLLLGGTAGMLYGTVVKPAVANLVLIHHEGVSETPIPWKATYLERVG